MDLRRLLPIVVLLVASASLLRADGCFVPVMLGVANTADQRAVIIDREGAQTIVLQTAYEGDSSDFAWVIPLPELISAQQAIGTADPELFDALDYLTAPRFIGAGRSETAGLCGCSGSEDGATGDGVTVWETLRIDRYDVAVLSAEQSAGLEAWLSANGYGLPAGSANTLQYYVDKHWYFVALKIAPVARADAGGGAPGVGGQDLRPVALSFDSPELVFPLRISRLSTRNRTEVLLYIVSTHRVEGDNYGTVEVQTPSRWAGQDFESAYDRWLEGTISGAGGKALVVEYAGWVPEHVFDAAAFRSLGLAGDTWYITRLRTRLSPAQMDADIVLTASASDADFQVVVGDAYVLLRHGASLGLLALAGVQGLVVRSRRGRRMALSSLLCALLIILL
ncbi:MAG: DUF2330 domain-containing protein [Armatimonadota bacterium]